MEGKSQMQRYIGRCAAVTHCAWCCVWPASLDTSSWSDNKADHSHNNWCYHSLHAYASQSCCFSQLDPPVTRLLVASNLHTVWQTSSNYSSAAVRSQIWLPAFIRKWYMSHVKKSPIILIILCKFMWQWFIHYTIFTEDIIHCLSHT